MELIGFLNVEWPEHQQLLTLLSLDDFARPEFHQTIAAELDFTQEARNMERVYHMIHGKTLTYHLRDAFLNRRRRYSPPNVIIPTPIHELTTPKLLTMTFEDGFKITNKDKLAQNGINPKEVAKATCVLFGELLYVHGFVHSDPHPGNILVRPRLIDGKESKNGAFDLVLLDHGMYRRLNEDFRRNYCDLWAGLVKGDDEQAKRGVNGMGLSDVYFDFLGMMLVYRIPLHVSMTVSDCLKLACATRLHRHLVSSHLCPTLRMIFVSQSCAFSFSLSKFLDRRIKLGASLDKKSLKAVRERMMETYGKDAFSASKANDFMESLPRDLLFTLRCTNLVRGVNHELGGTTIDRLLAFGAAASRGSKMQMPDSNTLSAVDVNRFTSDDALALAKKSLNQPVASEILGYTQLAFGKFDPLAIVPRTTLTDVWESLKISLNVWGRGILIDFLVWLSGRELMG